MSRNAYLAGLRSWRTPWMELPFRIWEMHSRAAGSSLAPRNAKDGGRGVLISWGGGANGGGRSDGGGLTTTTILYTARKAPRT